MATVSRGTRGRSANRRDDSVSLGFAALALALGMAAQCLVQQPHEPASLLRQVPGWLLFLVGGWLLTRRSRSVLRLDRPGSLPFAVEASLLALVLACALFLRLHDLRAFPPGGFRDEGENGNVAVEIMNGRTVDGTDQLYPAYIEQNTQNAAAYFYPVALSFKLFGISITSERYVSVFFGVLSVAAFWALGRCLFGPVLGLFLAACLAAMRWHINFSRIGFLGIMTVFLSLPMLLWLHRGLEAPAAPRARGRGGNVLVAVALALAVARGLLGFYMPPGAAETGLGLLLGLPMLYCAARGFNDVRSRWLMLSALALAMAMYSYIAARLFILLIAFIIGHHLLTRQRPLKARSWLGLAAATALLALGGAVLVFSSAVSASNAAWDSSAARWVGLGIAALGGLALLGFWWAQRDLFKGWVRPLSLALGVGLVVAGPLYSYTLKHHVEVAARSYKVSIFNDHDADQRPWGARLLGNLGPTLGMVNVRGDGNPRHNLPGTTMVDSLWAALFGLGLAWALLNLRDPRAWMALILWQVSLVAGYASMEAPQAYRCISAIPAVLLFIGLALERVLEPLKRRMEDDGELAVGLALALVLALGGGWEMHTYFAVQAHDPSVWSEFSTSEYEMGRDLKALNSGGLRTFGLVRPDWADSYTFRFMTYPEHNYEYFDISKDLPLRRPQSVQGGDFLYILGEDSLPLADILRGFYPHGVYTEVRHPMTNDLLYWTYWVGAADAARAGEISSGLSGTYFHDQPSDPEHPEVGPHWVATEKEFTRVDPFIFFTWPVTPVRGYFSAEWTGFLKAPRSGDYGFLIDCHSYAELDIDGQKVVERPFLPDSVDRVQGRIHLSAGRHRVRLRYYDARHYAHLNLWWTPPGGGLEVVPSGVLSKQ